MEITSLEIILYVADQQRSKQFYSDVLGKTPVLDVPGMTAFQLTTGLRLGLMPDNGIANILGEATPHPATGNGIPRCELYLRVDNPQQMLERALEAKAILISPVTKRDWGEEAGYVADQDGHVIAFARKLVE